MGAIRPLQPMQAAPLAALHALAFPPGWDEAALRSLLGSPATKGWASEEGGELQGFILCQGTGGELEILTLCVRPDQRRRGIARKLLAQVIRAAPQGVFLEVSAKNLPAISLYHSVGFEVFGRRQHYYRTAEGLEDAVQMRKKVALRAEPR